MIIQEEIEELIDLVEENLRKLNKYLGLGSDAIPSPIFDCLSFYWDGNEKKPSFRMDGEIYSYESTRWDPVHKDHLVFIPVRDEYGDRGVAIFDKNKIDWAWQEELKKQAVQNVANNILLHLGRVIQSANQKVMNSNGNDD